MTFWAFLLTVKQDTVKTGNRILWGFLVNSETGHSEDREPNLRHALGSVNPFQKFCSQHIAAQTRLLAPMADFDDGVAHARFNSHHAHIARQL